MASAIHKDVILGEIWSLIALIAVLMGILAFLSTDTLVVSPSSITGGQQALETDEAIGWWESFNAYISENRKAIAIGGYFVLSMLLAFLAVNLILWNHRRSIFRKQNELSKQRIAEYEKRLRESQKR